MPESLEYPYIITYRLIFLSVFSLECDRTIFDFKEVKHAVIVADMITKWGTLQKRYVIFDDEKQMEGVFRRLADRLKLSDGERVDLFLAARHWVKADQRLDPSFDRRDPDARRLVLH